MKLTQAEERCNYILDFIKMYTEKKGYPPTRREIAEFLDIYSTSLVTYYLKKLETDGEIKIAPHTARGIKVIG